MQALVIGSWSTYYRGIVGRRNVGDEEALSLVLINADPDFYVKHQVTGEEIRWSDVCAEPWPGSGPPLYEPYGEPPPDWPYGNGC